jgi:DNA-binding MarR family transcriptional regulator
MGKVLVTPHQREVLRLLLQHVRISVGELAALQGSSSASATKNVQRLEQKHLVKRVVDEWVRRRVLVSLTDEGRRVLYAPSE